MESNQRKAISDRLSKYDCMCDDEDFIEVTEWSNGEGIDVNIEFKGQNKLFSLTHGELDAINYLSASLNYKEQ